MSPSDPSLDRVNSRGGSVIPVVSKTKEGQTPDGLSSGTNKGSDGEVQVRLNGQPADQPFWPKWLEKL